MFNGNLLILRNFIRIYDELLTVIREFSVGKQTKSILVLGDVIRPSTHNLKIKYTIPQSKISVNYNG